MPGSVMPLLRRRRYDFSAGFSQVPIEPLIDVLPYRTGQLQVRLVTNGLVASSTLKLGLIPVLPSPEDPGKDFNDVTTTVAEVSLSASSAAPALYTADFVSDFGPFLALWLTATPSGGNCIATVSADLVLTT